MFGDFLMKSLVVVASISLDVVHFQIYEFTHSCIVHQSMLELQELEAFPVALCLLFYHFRVDESVRVNQVGLIHKVKELNLVLDG